MKKSSHRITRMGIVLLLVMFALGNFLPAGRAAAQTATVLWVDPALTDMQVGDVATIYVSVQDVVNLYGADIMLSFDPNVLEVLDMDPYRTGVQVRLGGFIQPSNEFKNEVDNITGTIRYGFFQTYPDLPKSGSGHLITIQVRAKSSVLISPIHFIQQTNAYPRLTAYGGIPISFTTQEGAVNARESADLSLTKTDGVDSVEAGDPLTYTIIVSNPGANAVTDALVTDTLPAGFESAAWTCAAGAGSVCTASGTGNIGDVVTLDAGASLTYTVTGTVNASLTGTLSNTAGVVLPPTYTDTNLANNTATDTTSVVPPVEEPVSVDLDVIKSDGVDEIRAGKTLTYTIVVANPGTNAVMGAMVTDMLPVGLESAAWTCVASAGSTCSASGTGNLVDTMNLAAGGTATYTLTAVVSTTKLGTLSNTASAAVPAGYEDPNPANNTATDATEVLPPLWSVFIPFINK